MGKIETILAEPKITPKGIAIIAHPHPLHGGTMDNKIVSTLFSSLLELGFIAVKFNFRGVGKSEGSFDHGIGEAEDVVTVAHTIRDQFSHIMTELPLLLAGFSFGGGIQWQVASRLKPKYMVLVAPSLQQANKSDLHASIEQCLIIHGDKDEIIPLNTTLEWTTPLSLPVVIIPGAEHFFHGKLIVLKRVILTYLRT